MLLNLFGHTIIIIMSIRNGKVEFYMEKIRRDWIC